MQAKDSQVDQQKYIDIADRMLERLEEEYLECQKYQINPKEVEECIHHSSNFCKPQQQTKGDEKGEVREQGKEEIKPDEEGQVKPDEDEHEGYQIIEGQSNAVFSDEQNQQQNEQQQQQANKDINPEQFSSLMQVFPTPDSTYRIEEPNLHINAEKIKSLTLQMNIPMPDWFKDEAYVQKRVKQLFIGK